MGQKSTAGPLRESSGGDPTPLLVDTEQEFADLAAPDARQDLLLRQLRKKGHKQGTDFSGLDPPNVRQVENNHGCCPLEYSCLLVCLICQLQALTCHSKLY